MLFKWETRSVYPSPVSADQRMAEMSKEFAPTTGCKFKFQTPLLLLPWTTFKWWRALTQTVFHLNNTIFPDTNQHLGMF